MKHIIRNILITAVFLLGICSCSDWLHLEPEGDIVVEDFWEKGSDVEAVIMSCYKAMTSDGFMKRVILWGELRSDNMVAGDGIKDPEKYILDVNILPSNDDCKWENFYTIINYCNLILHYGPGVVESDPDFTESQYKAKEAEVLALRALCYFYLVRSFRDVPLQLEPSLTDEQQYRIPKTEEEEILEKLVEDLLIAEVNAVASYGGEEELESSGSSFYYMENNPNKGRFTKHSIRALLADVYLWKGDYLNCITYCDKIIDSQKYQLIEYREEPYYTIFSQGNSVESIFELQFSTLDGQQNKNLTDLYGSYAIKVGQLAASASLGGTDIYATSDERGKDYVLPESNGYYFIFKYVGSLRVEDNTGKSFYNYKSNAYINWIFYRLSDIMLMKAEALVQLNRQEDDLREALSIVNTIYKRSNPTIGNDTLVFQNYATKGEMETLVLLERRRELAFEGKRWFDLLRLARRDGDPSRLVEYVVSKYSSDQSTIRGKMSVMDALYFPIHEAEIKANGALEQNPYYQLNSNVSK